MVSNHGAAGDLQAVWHSGSDSGSRPGSEVWLVSGEDGELLAFFGL
jgi:hypothetical protein